MENNTDWIYYHDNCTTTVNVSVNSSVCLEQASLIYDLWRKEQDPRNKFLFMGIANLLFNLEEGSLKLTRTEYYPNTGIY